MPSRPSGPISSYFSASTLRIWLCHCRYGAFYATARPEKVPSCGQPTPRRRGRVTRATRGSVDIHRASGQTTSNRQRLSLPEGTGSQTRGGARGATSPWSLASRRRQSSGWWRMRVTTIIRGTMSSRSRSEPIVGMSDGQCILHFGLTFYLRPFVRRCQPLIYVLVISNSFVIQAYCRLD
jgi:hypothetical protein